MPLVRAARWPVSRAAELTTQRNQGALGLLVLVAATALRPHEVGEVLARLSPPGPVVPLLLLLFASVLALNKFRLTREIFVSPQVVALVAMIPILGLVAAAWSAVVASIAARAAALAQVGPVKLERSDLRLQYAKLWGLLGTFGLPMVAAGLVYEALGGTAPDDEVSLAGAARLGVTLLAFQVANVAVMLRVQAALGYSWRVRAKLALVDTGIYVAALPYAVLVVWSWSVLGLRGLVLALLVGVLGTVVARRLADASGANQELAERLASLSNLAAAISVRASRAELFERLLEQCGRVVDTSCFSIGLVDPASGDLRFELDLADGVRRPPSTLPAGQGLNGWVVAERRPLLLGSRREEGSRALDSVADGVESESWLGVPMIVQERVIGVLSMQSRKRDAYTPDDVLLLSAVASQAAAAIDASNHYRDLEALAAELEARVAERTSELRERNLQLMAADRAKSRFLANMSHELRTPLHSILGFSDLLRSKAGSLTPREASFLDNIHRAGSHLLALIDDILDLSKIEAGRQRLEIAPFDLPESVRAVAGVMQGVAADAGVELALEIDERLREVALDEIRFRQILLNLLSNAVKYSPAGATVRLLAEQLSAAESKLGCASVRVRVVDAGPGIAEGELQRIFEEFYQVADGHRSRLKGTGLGLPLTKRLVELHGGRIDVESPPGAGATFVVELPLAAAGGGG
jgi:signal transduction histidine kinase